MSERPGAAPSDGPRDWPVDWDGVVESVVATRGPEGRWNVAALGLHAPDGDAPVTARTWGRTRTRRNFAARGDGYVQFTRDPVDFVEAACGVREESEPVLDSADAWAHVVVERLAAGAVDGTEWVDWALRVEDATIGREVVPVVSRAHAAIVEATVAASRLDVAGYDADRLRERIRHAGSVVERAGGARERAAWDRFDALVDWHGD